MLRPATHVGLLLTFALALAVLPAPSSAAFTDCASPGATTSTLATPHTITVSNSPVLPSCPIGTVSFNDGAGSCVGSGITVWSVSAVGGNYLCGPISPAGVAIVCRVSTTGVPWNNLVIGLDQFPFDGSISPSELSVYASNTSPAPGVGLASATITPPAGALVRPIAMVHGGMGSVNIGCA